MIIEVTEEERDLLEQLLSRRLTELGPEIHHTDKPEYRDRLKRERELFEAMQERLAPQKV